MTGFFIIRGTISKSSWTRRCSCALVGSLRGWARVAVAGYVAGGRAALAAIEAAQYDVLRATHTPGKAATAQAALRAYVTGR